MQTIWQDLRFGARMLWKNRTFTFIAVLALALGIGANTAVFSTTDALLLKPLDLSDLDRLVDITATSPQEDVGRNPVAAADYLDWQEQQSSFSEMATYEWKNENLTGIGDPERVSSIHTSANFFHLLNVTAALGRTFAADEDQPGRERVVVLTHSLWARRFGADPNIIGTTVALDGRSHTIIGVMAKDFEFPRPGELWVPLTLTAEMRKERRAQNLALLARLKADVDIVQARADLQTLAQRLEEQFPDTNTGRGVRVDLLRDRINGDYTAMFLVFLMGAAGFVLLIACVNIANMQLARATSRTKEIAVRAALGAGRLRLIRQLLTESVLLSGIGGVVGLLLAFWFVDLIRNSLPPETVRYISGWKQMSVNGRALTFTILIALLSGLVFGVMPALQVSKPDLNETLKEGGRHLSGGSKHRMRSALVVAEIALALVLLVGTGLMVKGFARLLDNQKQGFHPENVLVFRAGLTESRYKETYQRFAYYQQALERLRSLPGVESVSLSASLPASDNWISDDFHIEGKPTPMPGEERIGSLQIVSDDHFKTMRIPFLDGRSFAASDSQDAPRVALISDQLAKLYFPGENPLGKRIRPGSASANGEWYSIIGIVGDVRRFMFDSDMKPTLYLSFAQSPRLSMYFALRTTKEPLQSIDAARAQLAAIDADLPLYEISSMEKVIADQVSGIRLVAAMMGAFGLIAVLLAAVGVYGVMGYSVSQRTHEIGIRMALGASPGNVISMILKQGLKLTAVGIGLGLPLAYGFSQLMAGALFGLVAIEYTAIVGFTVMLTLVAMLSSYLPAQRAAKIGPLTAIRS